MEGIFYDRQGRRLRKVRGAVSPEWMLVTHNLDAGAHQCRRVMSEWLSREELMAVDFGTLAASA